MYIFDVKRCKIFYDVLYYIILYYIILYYGKCNLTFHISNIQILFLFIHYNYIANNVK
jgi:hypothetical protein